MPSVVMVNTVCGGSHGRIMRDLQLAATNQGYDVKIAYGRGMFPDHKDTIRIGNKADVLAHVALTRTLDRHALASKYATKQFIKTLKALAPDLLHLHNIHGYYLHARDLFDYINATGIPTVWTHHDCWAFTGHCSHFTRVNCQRWQQGCYECPQKREYPASFGLDASRSNWRWKREAFSRPSSLQIVTPSIWLSSMLSDSFLRDIPRLTVQNGVDLSLFRPTDERDREATRKALGVRPDQVLLTAVAAPFDARKGYADALQVGQYLGDQARVLLVGLEDSQLASLPPHVIGIKRTDGPESLVSIYNATDCLLNPTYEDTYPTVNMEAMACGTPVAGYAVGGATEQLESPCGIPVPVGNVEALATAALHQGKQKMALTALCRNYAINHFDRSRAIETYMALYNKMTGACT